MKRRNFLLASSGLAGSAFVPQLRAAQPCPPPQIAVAGGSTASTSCPTVVTATSVMGKLAQGMLPGTWAQVSASNQNPALGVGPISGTMIHYCNSMPWNPVARAVEVLAMDHNYGRLRYVRYVESTNQFTVIADDVGLGSMTQHGYDHVDVNPSTGDLYYRQFSVNSGTIRTYRKLVSSLTSFNALPALAATNGLEQAAIGACWWSGPFSGGGGHGAQGSFMVFNSGTAVSGANDGQLAAYNPLTGSWFFNKNAMSPYYGSGATYHSVMEYSRARNVAVYGGGNVAGRKLWRLNADGTFNTLTDVPSGKGVGMQQGLLVADPVTGNFILLSAGQLWELNPTGAGTWTQLSGSRTPPAGVGNPSAPTAVIACSIPEYGVIAYITQPSQTGGTFFLYKHA